jgi:nitronate monooxygenase
MRVDELVVPIIQAPLAGGPSTPRLAAAVSAAGGLGFVAAGYKPVEAVAEDIAAARALTDAAFGLNVFAPPTGRGDAGAVERYAKRIRGEAERFGAVLGEPLHDDDGFTAKVDLAARSGIAVVSFTFGLPGDDAVAALHGAGAEAWITVTSPAEATRARDAGADALIVQGFEAGGHRGYFEDDASAEDYGLLALLQRVGEAVDLPLIATGGIGNGRALAAVLCAGASAAQIGSAFLLAEEAGTSAPYREALAGDRPTSITRAFTGRSARGIVNRFMQANDSEAPAAYPEVHHMTSPLRAAARNAGDAEAINLWAGQAYTLARPLPATEIVAAIASEARDAVQQARTRLLG